MRMQAWQFQSSTIEDLTDDITGVCLKSLDARFQTHAVRLLDTLLSAVEQDFHGMPPGAASCTGEQQPCENCTASHALHTVHSTGLPTLLPGSAQRCILRSQAGMAAS